MNADTGQILLEKNMHVPRKPASITKIMTAMLALETGGPDASVSVSNEAVAANPSDGSSAGLTPGEIIPLEEILYAVMLESANEAANAVAEYVSGSMEDFAVYMTRRAKELGAENTRFANANGLNHDDHYTSAYDMALITAEAIKNPRFLTIWGTYQHVMPPTNLQVSHRILNNKNRMLPQGAMPYEGILGGKTGFTTASGNTLVESASRDGRTLLCVLMQGLSAQANFQDAALLLDYGFDCFRPVAYEDDGYTEAFTFLLHNDLSLGQVAVTTGSPTLNPDGSISVDFTFKAPSGSADLMYSSIASATLTTPVPPQPVPMSGLQADESAALIPLQPQSRFARALSGLSGLLCLLPGWLTGLIKAVLGLVAALFALACVFRTRRWYRRRKRRLRKQQMEIRRRTYREQQSFWS